MSLLDFFLYRKSETHASFYLFGELSKLLCVFGRNGVEFLVCFFWRCLLGDECLEKVVEVGAEKFVGQVGVFGQDVCRQVVVFVLAVEEQQVPEGFRWKRILL